MEQLRSYSFITGAYFLLHLPDNHNKKQVGKTMQGTDASAESSLLQNQFDSYEKYSLVIKLTAVVLVTAFAVSDSRGMFAALIVGILWLQDAIWKTFQARIEVRLVRLEGFFADEQSSDSGTQKPFQFNREYQAMRGGTLDLCREYCAQAVRPTVAFPYAALLLLCVV